MRSWLVVLGGLLLAACSSEDALPEKDGYDEHHPGSLVITEPARGAFLSLADGKEITVSGTGAKGTVSIDGQKVQASSDGSFTTTVKASEGLNLLRIVNGQNSLETPFLFGRFESPTEEVPSAVVLRLNQLGFDDSDSSRVSISLLARRALNDADILSALKGQTFSGSLPGGSWKFVVGSATHGKSDVTLSPRAGGASFIASVQDVKVKGKLTIKILISKTDDVVITAGAARVTGNINASLDGDAIVASTSSVQTKLYEFKYNSNNAGLPCCVDDIATDYLRPKVEKAVQDKVRSILANKMAFALNQFALPPAIELDEAGFPASIGIATHLDLVDFDPDGGTIGAAVRFHHEEVTDGRLAKAPGWLSVGDVPGSMSHDPALGVSLSLDALNQAFFVAWAQDGLVRTLDSLPIVGSIHVEPRLPPVVMPNENGGVTASAGEIVVTAEIQGAPAKAAITIIDDMIVSIDPEQHALVLTPAPEPLISITWLEAEGLDDTMRALVEGMINDKLPTLLAPLSLPLPRLPLGAIAPSFGEAVGSIAEESLLTIDASTRRVELFGYLAIVP